jgi:signal transduction histidine kinase/CheY-like chemotaxis protein
MRFAKTSTGFLGASLKNYVSFAYNTNRFQKKMKHQRIESHFITTRVMKEEKPPRMTMTQVEQESQPSLWKRLRVSLVLQYHVIRENPSLWILPVLVFCSLCAPGLAIVITTESSSEETLRREILTLAEDTGRWFSDQLDLAILPLFSLALFVQELDIFRDLPSWIGPANEEGSLPFIDDLPTHRNTTGVCDEPELLEHFTRIASAIKRNAKMEGVLVNLQLAPEAVVCMVHPLINTEDFADGITMDNSGVIGHDLLTDPKRAFIAQATLPSDKLVIAGPLTLKQCQDCDPVVRKAFIARLPIAMEGHQIEVNGQFYDRWGFAVAIINWNALVERSDVYEIFRGRGLEFQLTRTDWNYDAASGTYVEDVVVLADTPGFLHHGLRTVSTGLETTNNEWEITVAYRVDDTEQWKVGAIFATITVSFCISILVYVVLLQKQIHTDLVAEQSALLVEASRIAAVAERELNDFIAHEVRNPLAAAMSACTFVSSAVQEAEPLADEASRQSVRGDIGIIDVSLRFINELLRSMLDIHRAVNKQMTLDNTAVSVLHDIFEPVAAMLYIRDESFEVILDCPEDLLVMADRLRLQQVVLNLSRNSAKFVEKGYIRLRADVVDHSVCIYVEDSGPGIPESKRNNLFSRFQESLDAMNQGTGVGLNLCKNVVDLMEGDIYLDESFESGIEGSPGTRIVVNLKIPQEPLGSSHIDFHDEEKGFPFQEEIAFVGNSNCLLTEQLSVLFVDDDRILRRLASRAIKKIRPEWNVREAASGEMALQLAETESFDLIFMDQYMTSAEQALKGTETVRALRAKGVNCIICGLSANDLESAFISAGADSFVMKPFPCREDELRFELGRLLRPGSERCRLMTDDSSGSCTLQD